MLQGTEVGVADGMRGETYRKVGAKGVRSREGILGMLVVMMMMMMMVVMTMMTMTGVWMVMMTTMMMVDGRTGVSHQEVGALGVARREGVLVTAMTTQMMMILASGAMLTMMVMMMVVMMMTRTQWMNTTLDLENGGHTMIMKRVSADM
jgi:hypothetical protein